MSDAVEYVDPDNPDKEYYFCTECVHQQYNISWLKKLMMSGMDLSNYMVCRACDRSSTTINLITGKRETTVRFVNCETARTDRDYCGRNAKLWKPKDKKGFFKLLKKDVV